MARIVVPIGFGTVFTAVGLAIAGVPYGQQIAAAVLGFWCLVLAISLIREQQGLEQSDGIDLDEIHTIINGHETRMQLLDSEDGAR